LVQNTNKQQFGYRISVTKAGLYSIILNKKDREIIYGLKGFSHVWGVGLGIGIAWSMPSSAEFYWDPRKPGIFTLQCYTQANQDFKLPYNDQSRAGVVRFFVRFNANQILWEDNRFAGNSCRICADLKWLIKPEQAGRCLLRSMIQRNDNINKTRIKNLNQLFFLAGAFLRRRFFNF
jgi:hypothetical protein